MSTAAWLGIGAAVILVLYVLIMRLFMRESRELAQRIDYRKIKPWQEKD